MRTKLLVSIASGLLLIPMLAFADEEETTAEARARIRKECIASLDLSKIQANDFLYNHQIEKCIDLKIMDPERERRMLRDRRRQAELTDVRSRMQDIIDSVKEGGGRFAKSDRPQPKVEVRLQDRLKAQQTEYVRPNVTRPTVLRSDDARFRSVSRPTTGTAEPYAGQDRPSRRTIMDSMSNRERRVLESATFQERQRQAIDACKEFIDNGFERTNCINEKLRELGSEK